MALKFVVRRATDAPDSPSALTYTFAQTRVVIGRSPGADVRLPELEVSEQHAVVEEATGKVLLSDQGSTNGTRVNGVELVPKRARTLADGDEITIGHFVITLSASPGASPPTTKERTASLARKLLCDLRGEGEASLGAPTLTVSEGPDQGTVVELPAPPALFRVGRDETAELTLRDADVSRFHMEVERDLDGCAVRDLDSKNGLEVNGKRVRERRLRDRDQLRVGGTSIVFEDPAERALKALEGRADVLVTLTRPSVRAPSAHAEASSEPAPMALAQTLPPAQPVGVLDAAVYALAVLILFASLLGLWWLFGG